MRPTRHTMAVIDSGPAAYNIPPEWTGRGQTIVIVDAYGSPTLRGDLATFSAIFGLPAATSS